MSGANISVENISGSSSHTVKDISMINLLKDFELKLTSLIGPKGKATVVHVPEGIDTFVSTSEDLLQYVKFDHPCVKFVASLMNAQNKLYGCLGLYVGILSTYLYKEFLQLSLENTFSSDKFLRDLFCETIHGILSYIEKRPRHGCANLDISRLDHVLSVVSTTLSTKNVALNNNDLEKLKMAVVEAFLISLTPEDSHCCHLFGTIVFSVICGRPTEEVKVIKGVLYTEPDPDHALVNKLGRNERITPVNKNLFNNNAGKAVEAGKEVHCRVRNKYSRHDFSSCHFPEEDKEELPRRNLRIILFKVPLNFEQMDEFSLQTVGVTSSTESFYATLISNINSFINRVRGVDILACQKVVNEQIKYEMRKKGILVIDRLGTKLTEALSRLSGCIAISSLAVLSHSEENANDAVHIGFLSDVTVVEFGNRSYLLLENTELEVSKAPVVTILLPAMSSVIGDILKTLCEEALHILRLSASVSPLVVPAAGCLESLIACWLHRNAIHYSTSASVQSTVCVPSSKASNSDFYETQGVVSGLLIDDGRVDKILDVLMLGSRDPPPSLRLEVLSVFYKSFAKLSVLLHGGSDALTSDYCIDKASGHIFKKTKTAATRFTSLGGSAMLSSCSCHGYFLSSSDGVDDDLDSENFVNVSLFLWEPVTCFFRKKTKNDHEEALNKSARISSDVFRVDRCVLVESFPAKLNALRLALEGVSQLIDIEFCMFDR